MTENEELSNKKTQVICSFCGEAHSERVQVIVGPKANICSQCVGICNEIIWESETDEDNKSVERNGTSVIIGPDEVEITAHALRTALGNYSWDTIFIVRRKR
jgi:ATP-dependent Clp protease ATP-binding subunit ClpX